jgi:pilus assembly protein FimV
LFETGDAAAVDVDLGADAEEIPQPGQDTGASGAWLDFDVGESDGSDEVSYESIGDTQEQRALEIPGTRAESTAEINLEELGIDLELGESGEYALQDLADLEPEAGDEEEEDGGTMMMERSSLFRGTNDPTQRGEGFEVSEDEPTLSGESGLEQEPAGDEPTVMGLEDEEADQTLVKKFELPPEEAPTTEVDTFETEDEDLDLEDLTQVLEAELGRGRSEDEQATQLADGFELESTDEEDELPEEELGDTQEMPPVEMDEVGTKLDLARAYIDMGDPDGARSILEEVAAEGDERQQEEARELLDSLD